MPRILTGSVTRIIEDSASLYLSNAPAAFRTAARIATPAAFILLTVFLLVGITSSYWKKGGSGMH